MRTNATVTLTMTTAVLAAAVMGICSATTVHAQDSAQRETNERLRACGALSGVTEQLECFNAIVESLDQSPAAPVVEATSAMAATSDASAVGMQSAPATVTTTAATLSGQGPPAAKLSSPATVNTAEPDAGTEAAEKNFGLKTMQAKAARKKEEKQRKKIKSIRATIVSAWPTVDGRFEARLDNGQVWRETARTRRMRLPKAGSPVVIKKGRLGSYKMKIGNDNRLAAVRRTE